MNQPHQPQDIAAFNENSLQELSWAIASSRGEFSLLLAHCNSASLRQRLTQRLQESCPVKIREIILDQSITTLYTTIQAELGNEHPQALIVSGLESVKAIDSILLNANQVREEFRKNFPFPVVLWATDEVLQKLIRLAPDLQSWTTTVDFAIPTEDLIQYIQQTADEVFTKVLAVGAGRFLDNTALNLGIGSPWRTEMELARVELQNRGVVLHPEIEASLEFVLGRDPYNSMEQSRQHYERSLALFGYDSSPHRLNPKSIERQACLLYSLGLWWHTYAVLNPAEVNQAREEAKNYLQQCIEIFEQANRPDLVAKFINALGEVLQRLEHWEALEAVGDKALALHQTYPDQFKLARAYGFLAEVALAKSAWTKAQQTAEQAISILASAQPPTSTSISLEISADLDWEKSAHRGWYLFALARSLFSLSQVEKAIATLETARTQTKPQYDPELYIGILRKLRDAYFQQGQYLTAFHIKQDQRSIEQQYGFRAFIGAGRLQPKQQVTNPGLAVVEKQGTVAQEIAASGRQQDINRLVERMGRPDHKLTIIHGQSGVGKSSILQAGLIPALKQRSIGTRDVLPVLQQVYPDWIRELGDRLRDATVERGNFTFDLTPLPPSLQGKGDINSPLLTGKDLGERSILEQLEKHDDYNLLTVLIFDQFEEFFFVYKEPKQRRHFYEFLRECLDIPYIKVILTLREDYLHYLLECNNRFTNFEVINNNILDKDILYYLGNFSPEDAKSLIQSLTAKTQFFLEPLLIDELVNDLARELGEVRPIELQVVGAQLQTEKITRLEQYQQHGPKEKLVGRFLEEIVKDCGSENEQIAKLILYLLTDEKNTRPLKTRADLELELEVKAEKLDLVLEILVKSGLVFKVPAVPTDRYQLVHDYLVPFVRQQQSARLIAELEKEREQRKLTEARLNEVLKQQLLEARRGLVWKVSLGVIAGGLAIFLPLVLVSQNNAQLLSMSTKSQRLLESSQDLQALIEILKAGKLLQHWWSIGVKSETKMQVIGVLQNVVYGRREHNTLEGHSDNVTCVNFSPDEKMVVSGSADGTLIIWRRDGSKKIPPFKAHDNNKITSVSFSADSKRLVSASLDDGTVKLWNLDGKLVKTLQDDNKSITSVRFSPDNQKVVAGHRNGIIKLWSLDGKVKTFQDHNESITSINFSPDGKLIVSIADKKVKLWSLDGKVIKTWNRTSRSQNYMDDNLSILSPNGKVIASDIGGFAEEKVQLSSLDGNNIKVFSSEYLAHNMGGGNTIPTLSFSSDGQSIAVAKFYGNVENYQNVILVTVYKLDTGNSSTYTLLGHTNAVTGLSFSPDLQMLASASEDKTVRLWSLERRNFLPTPASTQVTEITFSPNSQIVGSVSGIYDHFSYHQNSDKVQLWQRNGTLITTLPGRNSAVSFSPNNQMLVSASQDRTVQLWRGDGTFLKTLQGEVVDGSFSPDGRTIALVKNDNTVELSSNDGKAITILKGHKDSVHKIRFSPDRETLVTASKDNIIKFWRWDGSLITTFKNDSDEIEYEQIRQLLLNGETLAIFDGNRTVKFLRRYGKVVKLIKTLKYDQQISVTFSPDQEIVAISNQNHGDKDKVELWRIDGTFLTTLQLQGKSGYIRGFTPDSQIIVTSGKGGVQFWRRDGSLLSTFNKEVSSVSPDFQTLVTLEGNNKVKLWRSDGTPVSTIQVKTKIENLKDSYSNYPSFSFSPDGQTLVIRTNENTVELWRIDGTFLKTFSGLSGREIEVYKERDSDFSLDKHMSFRSDSSTLAIRTDVNEVKLWGINGKASTKLSLLKTIKGHGDWIESMISIPNSETIAIIEGDDTVKLWKLASEPGKEIQLLKTFQRHNDQVTSVSVSPDGKLIASASNDKTVKLWQRDGKLLNTFIGHNKKVNSVSFSPNGQLIASGSDDKTVNVWRINGILVKTFNEHGNAVNSVSFSPNGEMIVSASQDNTLKLWSVNDKDSKSIKTLHSEEPVRRVSFSPDGQLIASASDEKVKLWSIDGTLLTTFQRFGRSDVSFSPDGKTIAAPTDQGVSVWNFDLNELLKRGCDAAHDYLKNNPKVKESDRTLCDDISTQK